MGIIQTSHKEIVGDDRTRAMKCMQEVTMALDKYDCAIIPKFMAAGQPDGSTDVQMGIGLVALSRDPKEINTKN